MPDKKRDRIFISFLTSYLIILFLTIGLGALSYTVTLRIIEKDTSEANMAMLEKSRQIIEGRFAEIERILKQIAMHPQVTRISYSDNPLSGGSDLIRIQDVRDLIVQYQWQDSFLVSLHLFLDKSGIIISTDDLYLRKDYFYNKFFKFKDFTGDSWERLLFSEIHNIDYLPLAEVISSGRTEPMLGILQSLIVKGFGLTRNGVICAFISGEEISDLLGSSLLKGDGVSLLLDKNRHLLAASGELSFPLEDIIEAVETGQSERNINGSQMILSSVISEERGWTYITLVPRRIAMKKIVSLRRILLLIVTGCFLLGIPLSYFFARKTSAPLREIRGILDGRRDLLKEGISQNHFPEAVRILVQRNHIFRERISRQKGLLHASFIESLIMGKYDSNLGAEQSYSFLDESSLTFPMSILCIKILADSTVVNQKSPADLLSFRLLLRTVSEEIIRDRGICHDTALDSMIILNHCPEKTYEASVEDLAAKIHTVIHLDDDCRLLFSSSRRAESFLDISRSYKEGMAAMNYLFDDSQTGVRWYQNIPEEGISLFTLDFEKRLINSVLAGESATVAEKIGQLKRDNFIENRLSFEAMTQFRNDIRSTILKIRNRIKLSSDESAELDRELKLLASTYTKDNFFQKLEKILQMMASLQNSRKRSHNEILKENVLAHMKERFSDSGFYLSAAADHFDLSDVYLSQFFKEQTGENFSSHLEKIRIGKARELMTTGKNTLSEISEMCGYNSPQVFRRAFKRIEGISPSQFREKL